MDKKGKILIIDDNEDVLFALNILLSPHVEKIKVSTNPEKAEHFMEQFQPDVILLDMNFRRDVSSGQEGFFWLEKLLNIDPQAVVILMTAYADTEKAVQAIKAGAADFISKPWEKEKLLATLFSALKLRNTQKEISTLKKQMEVLNTTETAYEIIGESEAMQEIFSLIDRLSDTDANILILGENGTGKDLIARAIYHHSPRSDNVFVGIDLGSIPDSLFESELFGYERGAFTDAKKEKPGRMEAASGGTLFLDEIGNLSLTMQSKILTAIEKKYISRLGSNKNIPIDVRFISATNADIYEEVGKGNFRQDLLYRINTIEIHIPPLRERGHDILAAEGIRFSYGIIPENMIYKVDRAQIEQVLINLIKNAWEACTEKLNPDIRILFTKNEYQQPVITISDHGEGILPEVLDKIFVPFFTTKQGGSGIGLSICRQIINAHGGTISVTSEPGKGSCVTVRL